MQKQTVPTLEKISDLLDKKLGEFRLETNDRFREVIQQQDNYFEQLSGRLSGIEDRLGTQGDRIREIERGITATKNLVYQKISEVKEELNNRFEDSERNFEKVLNKIQEFIGVTAESEDKKIKELKNIIEPRLEKMEHQLRFSQNEEHHPFATL